MGKYTPAKPGKERSLSETLDEAEHDHYLDCPDADFLIRTAAILLDVIFLSLASTAVRHLIVTLDTYAVHWLFLTNNADAWFGTVQTALRYGSITLKVVVGYLYLVWAVTRFGGSAGKLLLGLRVVDTRSGATISLSRALGREILVKPLAAMALVGAIPVLVRKDRRGLHDLACSTSVKRVHGEL